LVKTKEEKANKLLKAMGKRYPWQMGIYPEKGEEEIFKWFLASILFGARIGEQIAKQTYHQFEADGLLSPHEILDAGWDDLVRSLDAGGYVRYDFKTADKLLEVMSYLLAQYGGSLSLMHEEALDKRDIEKKLMEIKGIGPGTTAIFLRELREIWEKADPLLQDFSIQAAKHLGFIEKSLLDEEEIREKVKALWKEQAIKGYGFPDFEDALLRLGKNYCRKQKCKDCPMKEDCKDKES
jgi:endonuclease III